MDVLIIAGISKSRGSQFGVKHEIIKDGMVMNYVNLQKYFGVRSNQEFPSFSTPYLAGIYLFNFLSRRGIDCGLINFLDVEIERFQKFLKQSPMVIALSSSFLTDMRSVKKVTQLIRQYAPDTKIILGGPLVYNSYLLYQLRNSDYDTASCAQDYFFLNSDEHYYRDIDLFVIEEQGEKTLYQVVEAMRNGQDYSEVPNLAYYKNDRLFFTAPQTEHNDFTSDLIQWDRIPDEYIYPIFPLRGSLGCP
jgi:anaerobic magnesium-protoporphyrin IX monomethyl ester cyclase